METNRFRTITHVVNHNLCSMCGACESICPCGAIAMKETKGGLLFPYIEEGKCNRCGLCLEVCPGLGLGKSLIESLPDDPFAGTVQETYVGKSTGQKIFDNSQSGGAVTAVLSYLLDKGEIEAAIVTKWDSSNIYRPLVYFAETKAMLLESQKSIYSPVPLLSALSELNKNPRKVAFVGLGCHVEGIKKVIEQYPELKKNISYIFGLVCDRTLSYLAIDLLKKKFPIKDPDISGFSFRDKSWNGYPGDVTVKYKTGEKKGVPASERMRIKDYFTPPRCRVCFDKMNIFSDITFGDPHGIEGIDRKHGESLIICRTGKGSSIINECIENNIIKARFINKSEAINGQGIALKKQEWIQFTKVWAEKNSTSPDYTAPILKYLSSFTKENDTKSLGKIRKRYQLSENLVNVSDRDEFLNQVQKKLFVKKITSKTKRMLGKLKNIFSK